MLKIFYCLTILVTAILIVIVMGRYTFCRNGEVQRQLMTNINLQGLAGGREKKPLSTDAVAIAAYFDKRKQDSHDNATVIFAAVIQTLERNITGCEVDGVQELNQVAVQPILITAWLKKHRLSSHTELLVLCFDMEPKNNSRVRLLLEVNGEFLKIPVMKDFIMPVESIEKDEVMVCATGFGSPNYLNQWLQYQQKIGVNFIHLNVHPSFLQNVNRSEILQKFLERGYVKMIVWEEQLNESQVYYYSQSFKYQDCLFRYQTVYKYMFVIDFDEYFIPLDKHTHIIHYAKRLLGGKIASAKLPIHYHYCKKNGSVIPADGNMTKLYDTTQFGIDRNCKSIHLVNFVKEVSVHTGRVFHPHRVVWYKPLQAKCYISHLTTNPMHIGKCKR